MSNTTITYLVGACCGVFALTAYVAFILVPAWTAYSRTWERVAAPVACWVAAKAGADPQAALEAAREIDG